ncbi:MAG: amino acid permease, partial [Candidatus Hydrogenedentes bacterium]|nr:amino acid permease [Candidatus Hydrogenedentota bacterium]
RRIHPNAERPFRCPYSPYLPIMGIVMCLMLMFSLPSSNWERLLGWLIIGGLIYVFYGRHHSVMAKRRAEGQS